VANCVTVPTSSKVCKICPKKSRDIFSFPATPFPYTMPLQRLCKEKYWGVHESNDPNHVLSPPPNVTWHCLQVSNGNLWVADTLNPKMGFQRTHPGHDSAVCICLPRVESLNIMGDSRHLCMVVQSCAKSQPTSLSRGTMTSALQGPNKMVVMPQ
jgi:hypothetical protein